MVWAGGGLVLNKCVQFCIYDAVVFFAGLRFWAAKSEVRTQRCICNGENQQNFRHIRQVAGRLANELITNNKLLRIRYRIAPIRAKLIGFYWREESALTDNVCDNKTNASNMTTATVIVDR